MLEKTLFQSRVFDNIIVGGSAAGMVSPTAREPIGPPLPVLSDYLEIVYLTVLFVMGAPLNLAAYSQLSSTGTMGGFSRLHILKRNLNIADLMVILIYTPSQVCWLLTYDWRGGVVMCKLMKFIHAFIFQLSSNIIVCIALDRVLSILFPETRGDTSRRRVKIILFFAWILAAGISSPQLMLWTTINPYPDWHQCMNVYYVEAMETASKTNMTLGNIPLNKEASIYSGLHLLTVFYIPLIGIAVSYVIIAAWVIKHTRIAGNRENGSRFIASQMGGETGDGWDTVGERGLAGPYPAESQRLQPLGRGLYSSTTASTAKLESGYKSKTELNELFQNLDQDTEPEGIQSLKGDEAEKESPMERKISSEGSGESSTPSYSSKIRSKAEKVNNPRKVKRKAIRISFLLVVAYIICWTPYSVLSLWQFLDKFRYDKWEVYVHFLHGLIVLNSVINPFLYGMFGGIQNYARNG